MSSFLEIGGTETHVSACGRLSLACVELGQPPPTTHQARSGGGKYLGCRLVEESPCYIFSFFPEIFRSVFSCPPRAPGEHASADEANGYRDLLQMDHEEAPAHFHRVDDFQLRAGVEQHLHGG